MTLQESNRAVGTRYDGVQPRVPVEIRQAYATTGFPEIAVRRRRKGSVAVVEQHGKILHPRHHDDEIRMVIAIEIGNSHTPPDIVRIAARRVERARESV